MFLETKSISKEFGRLYAVRDVSLEITRGDIHAIIGPNGAGKSTYFNLITGYHPATSGRVLFKGEDITDLPAYRRCKLGITRSFQITSIYPKFTVYESVLMGLLVSSGYHAQVLLECKQILPGRGLAHSGGRRAGRPGQYIGRVHLPRG